MRAGTSLLLALVSAASLLFGSACGKPAAEKPAGPPAAQIEGPPEP